MTNHKYIRPLEAKISFCTAKDTIISAKLKPTEWEKNLPTYASDSRLISKKNVQRITKLNVKKKPNNQI